MVDSDFGFGGGELSQEENKEDSNNNNENCVDLEASALEASALEEAAVKEAAVEEEEKAADGNGGAIIAVQASKMVVPAAPTAIPNNNQDSPGNNNNNNSNNNSLEELQCDSNEDDSDGEGATCWDEEDPMLENSIGESNNDWVDGEDTSNGVGNNEDADTNGVKEAAAALQTQTRKHQWFTIQQKMSLIHSIEAKMVCNGTSMRQAWSNLNLNTKQYTDWKNKLPLMENSGNKNAKSMGIGPPSSLFQLKEQLLSFIFELHEQGMGVTTHMVVLQAAQLSRTF